MKMPSNLSHCLVGMTVCGALNLVMGLPPISSTLFFAGFVSMLINLDYSSKTSLKRTPWGHSIFSPVVWSMTFLFLIFVLYSAGTVNWNLAFELSLVFSVAYVTHLALDFFTTEGVYIFKGGQWVRINCTLFGMEAKDESSALLNIYLCIPAAVAIMIFVGIVS